MEQELKVRKILGRTYLNENKLAEALDIFVKILADYPDDLETLLILGGFYLAGGDGKTAKALYLQAQKLDPQNKTIERQIALTEEMEENDFEDSVPTDLDAVGQILQRLTGRPNAIDEKDIARAASLLSRIVSSEKPAELVSTHMDEIDDLLLALIEVNIRQAHADGRVDVAEALHNLQLNIDYQLVAKEEKGLAEEDHRKLRSARFTGSVLMLLPDLESKSKRMAILGATLESYGCRVTEQGKFVSGQDVKPDVVITSNPHTNPALVESLSALSSTGVPIIVDLDTDVENQPVTHQEYNTKGLGTQIRGSAYATAISFASIITVPSEAQAVSLEAGTSRVCVIPDGWSRQNGLWEKSPAPRNTINLGWVGSSGQLEDLMLIRRFMIRIVREFPNTRIVIIGNPRAYRAFDGLPENRRLYMPQVAHDEFPYLLGQLDILLVPLRNLPYNLTLSDAIVVEAGAKGIPWIASPVPAFRSWMAGGIISESLDEWHLNLRQLVMDQELRKNLGQGGREAAKAREMDHVGKLWLEIIAKVADTEAPLFRQVQRV